MNLLAIVDTETTCLDPWKGSLLEVAVVRWSVEAGCAIDSWAQLVKADTNEAESVNGISVKALSLGVDAGTVGFELNRRLLSCDAILAHNAGFDKGWLDRHVGSLPEKPWICTKNDVEWQRGRPGCSLVELAVAHGVPVVAAHRALTDCMLIAGVLRAQWESRTPLGGTMEDTGPFDLAVMLQRAMRPKITVEAVLPYERRDEAKAARFRWEPGVRKWLRTMAAEDVAALPFDTRPVAQ